MECFCVLNIPKPLIFPHHKAQKKRLTAAPISSLSPHALTIFPASSTPTQSASEHPGTSDPQTGHLPHVNPMLT
nr:MAG TPA: hypothetical protein [Caudoviricetes sp.]